ncbi:MAG: T9SS type A sorting domain-containing protein [Bacteroidia bacterium]
MKTKINILIFILSLGIFARAQNLVPNGDFEIYSACPNNISQINYASGWQAAASTPDYFNACTSTTGLGTPDNYTGYQQDCCGGQGYAGFYMLDKNAINNDNREYIYTKLIDTLKAGHKYLASMYVNKANLYDYAVATIGMLFTDTAIILPFPQGFINSNPQIKNNTLISDTINWILVQDTLTATGNEVYLTIGNFNTNATSDSVKVSNNGYDEAYYFIDGVSVYDVATLGVKETKNDLVEINIFPNPSNGAFTVQYDAKENTRMEIVDINGNLVGTYNLPTTRTQIEVKNENLQNGVYLYRIISNNNMIKFGRIVVMK